MTKPIEERVKTIVENNELLTIKEKSEIICLIECYKSADKLVQQYFKENQSLKENVNKTIKFIEDTYCSKNTTNIDSIVMTTNKLLKIREMLKGDK